MKTNNEHDLVLRALDDELSDDELNRLVQLLESSPEARQAQKDFMAIRSVVSSHKPERFQDGFTDRVMASLPADSSEKTARIYHLSNRVWLRAAAVILLLVSISALVWMQPRSYSASYGRTVLQLLPDGTSVLLSSGSTLQYKPFWGRQLRQVHLEGEAFFDVTKSHKPFVVETFNAEVRVLGTRFNVKSWPAAYTRYTAVALEEGRVEVTASASLEERIELAPSQSTIIYADSVRPVAPRTVLLDNALAWKNGGLGFDNEPLADVAAELGRRYNVRLTLSPELRQKHISYLKPEAVPLDTVLSDLSHSFGLEYRATANGFEITG